MKNKNIIQTISGFVNNWIIIAALVIIAVIGGLVYYTKGPKPDIIEPEKDIVVEEQEKEVPKQESEMVIMKLSADKSEYNLNELVKVDISLVLAGKKTPGVDVLVKYDPKVLELQKISGGKLQTSGKVSDPKQILKTADSSFETFPYLKADILEGSIFFSALDKPQEYVVGDASVSSIVFKAIKKGNAKISLVSAKNTSLDTEVFYMGNAILDKVIDAEIIIK